MSRQNIILIFSFLSKFSLQTHFGCCVNVNRNSFLFFVLCTFVQDYRVFPASLLLHMHALYLASKAIKVEIIPRSFPTIFRARTWSSYFYSVPHLFCVAQVLHYFLKRLYPYQSII